jgi:hypothetical protein
MDENRITYFAETDARNRRVRFGIKAKDRTRHVYVIGKTGMGKSTMLENMAVQDIQNGEGMCFIDPHGKTADLLLEYVPKERIRDVIYIAPFDVDYPISFNVLESVDSEKRHLVVSGLMSTFKKIWEDAWSARMEYILTNTLLALLEAKGSTLLGVNRMLSDKEYRKQIVAQVKDPSVNTFWTKEFANYTERTQAEAVPAIQNKVGQFTANPLIRNMIGQPHSSFDFREAMDKRKIVIINLSKGKVGDENMKLLGGLLVTKIYLAAMSRADIPDRAMKIVPNFYLFVDEFQNFANASFADILSEARKYKLNLTIAHQYIEQMDEVVRPAVFGNVGTMITFRVGATDAEELEKEFSPTFVLEDLVNLGFTQIYLKLMIDGLSSTPFSATTLPPIPHPDISYVRDIITASREQFARPRASVEEEIIKFHNPMPVIKKVENSIPRPQINSGPENVATKPKADNYVSTSSKNIPVANRAPIIPTKNTVSISTSAMSVKQRGPGSAGTRKSFEGKPTTGQSVSGFLPRVDDGAYQQPKSEPIRPVPLSSLIPKPKVKTDPKVQSSENVSDLKSALAQVLGKAKPPENNPKVFKPVEQRSDRPKTDNTKTISVPPKEVPEEVLNKVLKVD